MGACISRIGGMDAVGGIQDQKFNQGDALEAVQMLYSANGLSSQLELSLSASKLRNRDILSKSDPMAVVYLKMKNGTLEELGRTEVCLNSLSPSWVTKVRVLYCFEELQVLLFRIYDVDTNFKDLPTKDILLSQQQFLGEMECVLSQIATSGECITRALQPMNDLTMQAGGMPDLGVLTVQAEEMANSKCIVVITVDCANLENKDVFTKSDPFLQISKQLEDGSFKPVYKSEVKNNTLNPKWKPIKSNLQQLCNGDMDCPLKVECFDFNSNGKHDLIGAFVTSLNKLQTMANNQAKTVNLEQRFGGNQQSIKIGGQLRLQDFQLLQRHSFLDYIQNGFELSFLVAIDFTASNGNPHQRDSLHYIDPSGRFNAYQAAICAVGEVLEYYDSDKQFSVWGFGGKPTEAPVVSHCFNVSKHSDEVSGIEGILQAYVERIRNVRLAGPTLFGPVINKATSIAQETAARKMRKYYVLMIITDGVITDLQESINALILASSLPLSVVIVGVGGADFTEMEYLDADRGRLQSSDRSKVAARDIVQFVPMRNATSAVSLASMLLAELPAQFLEYMEIQKILPIG